jgi:hypothetical protein
MRPLLLIMIYVQFAVSIEKLNPRPVALFDGNDLAGWELIGGGKAFVENGKLIVEHDAACRPGYLVSIHPPLRDFVISMKCRVPIGDSGLFFRGERHPLHTTEFQGPQVQLNQQPGCGLGGLFEHHGRGWIRRPAQELREALPQPNEPFEMTLRAEGSHLFVTINGRVTVDMQDAGADNHFLRAGRFALQIHGGGPLRAEFERIELLPLPAPRRGL